MYSRGALYEMLKNRIYLGEITHKDAFYEGLHEAIVDREIWEQVQERLKSNLQSERRRPRATTAMEHIRSESSPGIHAIGSGAALAMDQLNKRAQNLGFSLARTVFHVHEAMLEAQKEKTVGPPTNYLILTKGQPMTHISPDSELPSRWRSGYTGRDTDGLDNPDVNFAVQREMKRVQMPPCDIELPVVGDSS